MGFVWVFVEKLLFKVKESGLYGHTMGGNGGGFEYLGVLMTCLRGGSLVRLFKADYTGDEDIEDENCWADLHSVS